MKEVLARGDAPEGIEKNRWMSVSPDLIDLFIRLYFKGLVLFGRIQNIDCAEVA